MKPTGFIKHSERGIALLAALFALLLLSAIAVGMMYMANSETQINANYKDSEKAFWGARAGLEEARARLFFGPTSQGDLVAKAPTVLPGIANSILYLTPNPGAVIGPQASDTTACRDFGAYLLSQGKTCTTPPSGWVSPLQQSYAPQNPYQWVRITLKDNASNLASSSSIYYVEGQNADHREVCWTGSSQRIRPTTMASCSDVNAVPRMNPVYVLTAFATAPGGASRYEQMEVANNPPFNSNAAVDSEDLVVLKGSLDISGFDACSCKCTDGSNFCDKTLVTDRAPKTCDKNKWAIYSKSTITQNGNGHLYAGSGSTLATATSQLNDCSSTDPNKCFPYDISTLISTYQNQPGTVDVTAACYTGGPTPCGLTDFHLQGDKLGGTLPVPFPPTYNSDPSKGVVQNLGTPQITYFNGDVQLNANASGNGILIVDGNLQINGGFSWYGLILVKGIVDFTGGGSDQNIWGAVLNGTSVSKDDSLGGSSTIAYDRCALDNFQTTSPPKMLSFREITY